MTQISAIVKKFFEDFEQASNTFEGNLLASQFSDPFMAADPDGHIQVARKDEFIAGTAKRQAFFQSLGFQFVKVVPLAETRLDEHYLMVKAQAHMQFAKTPEQSIDITSISTYVLFMKGEFLQIVFSLTHENLMEIMQKHGLV